MFRRERLAGIGLAALLLAPGAGVAQLSNAYVPLERTIPEREEIENQMQSSRYRLGPFRLLPRIALRGPSYNSNEASETGEDLSSWTVSASAGLATVVPLGKKVYVRGLAYPEYIWSSRSDEDSDLGSGGNQWGGVYGGGVYAFFNRLALQGDYQHSLTPTYPNSEIQAQVLGTSESGQLRMELNLTGKLSLFGAGEYLKSNYESFGPIPPSLDPLQFLDRTEWAGRGGLRYKITDYFNFGVAYENTWATFPDQPARADNASTAYLAAVHFDRPRLFVNFQGGYRIGRPRSGSDFPAFETFTGSGFVSYDVAQPVSLSVYGRRGISYGLFLENPYYFENLGGVGATFRIGQRINVRAFGEFGDNVYPVPIVVGEVGVERRDKVTAYGGGIGILLFRSLSVTATARNTDYDSTIPGFTRSVLTFTSGIVLGELLP